MREINHEIGLDDALRNMGVGDAIERPESSDDEKSRCREVSYIGFLSFLFVCTKLPTL